MRNPDTRRYRKLVRAFYRATGGIPGHQNCCGGLTLGQCHVLMELEEVGEAGSGTLAERLGLDKSTVSRTVEELVQRNLVSRAIDSADRRFSVLSLTNAGLRKSLEIHRINDETVRSTFAHIPRDRHAEVLDAFRLLVDATVEVEREQRSGVGDSCGAPNRRERRARS